jgi:hypothetical protein
MLKTGEREAFIRASKEVGLQRKTEKTKYTLTSCHQKAGRN